MRNVCVGPRFQFFFLIWQCLVLLNIVMCLCEELEFHNLHISSTQLFVDKNMEDEGHRRFVLIPTNHSAETYMESLN